MVNVKAIETDVEVKTIEKQKRFVLELSEFEAKVLHMVVGSILGDSHKSIRGITDSIFQSMEDAGVESEDCDEYKEGHVTAINNKKVEQFLKEQK